VRQRWRKSWVSSLAMAKRYLEQVMISSLAIRCHHLEKMIAFYAEAFGAGFRRVEVGGMTCHFGRAGALTIKLVPGRDSADFSGYPFHQVGIEVDDVDRVIEIAIRHGGAAEGAVTRGDQGVHGCVRDPDGNTIELYG